MAFDHFIKLAEEKPVFIIFQYEQTLHKMLIILQKTDGKYTLSFFDSLGITPWKRIQNDGSFYYFMKEIIQKFSDLCGDSLTIYSIGTTRQKDKVNCGSIVAFDFELAFHFLKDGIPLFKNSSTPHPSFLEISQQDLGSSQEEKRYSIKKEQNKMVNVKASMIALNILKFYLENKVSYPQENSQFDEKSELDEEGCVIS